jgi:hypothetical protein
MTSGVAHARDCSKIYNISRLELAVLREYLEKRGEKVRVVPTGIFRSCDLHVYSQRFRLERRICMLSRSAVLYISCWAVSGRILCAREIYAPEE